jgi:hypothetical protein
MSILQKPAFGLKPKASPIRKGLVLDFPMLGTGDLQDYSGNKNNGTNNGATWTSGQYGPVLSFAATSYIELPTGYRGLDGLTDFTIIVKCLSTDLSSDNGIFYTRRHNGSDPLLFWFDNASPDHFAFLMNGSSGGTGSLFSTFVPLENTFYEVAIVFSGGNSVRLYIDGIEDTGAGDFPFSGSIGSLDSTTTPYRFATDSEEGKQLKGQIERALIFTSPLSGSGVLSQYNDPWQPYRKENIALWAAAQGGAPPVVGGVNLLDGLFERKRLIA